MKGNEIRGDNKSCSKASLRENEMRAWHCQSPAAHVLVGNKLILAAWLMRGGVYSRVGGVTANATVVLVMHCLK